MKRLPLLTALCLLWHFSFCHPAFPQPDSMKKKTSSRWFITTYPSSILLGDISAGTEFSHKRFRQELALFFKTYNFWSDYLYDRGMGLNYYLKFNLIDREDLLFSVDLGYVYRRAYYRDKAIPLAISEYGQPLNSYKSDRSFVKSGLSVGPSTLIRLRNRFFLGFSTCLDWVRCYSDYSIKEHLSGAAIMAPGNPNLELPLPYSRQRNWVGFSATVLIKLACEL